MNRLGALLIVVAIATSWVEAARAEKYHIYNLPKDAPMDIPAGPAQFLDAFRARFGATIPTLANRPLAIETGMPQSFRNWEYGNCGMISQLKLAGYVEVYFYVEAAELAQKPKKFVAFTIEDRALEWLVALVKADEKADAERFDDDARRLVMAFASRIGNYGSKGYVKEDVVDRALDLFIEGLKGRNVAKLQNEAVVKDFEAKIEEMAVNAGHFWNKSNDTAEKLSERGLELLPESLGR